MESLPSAHHTSLSGETSDFIILAEGQTSQYFIHQLHQHLPESSIKVFVNRKALKNPTEIEKLAGLSSDHLLTKEEWDKTASQSNITFCWNSCIREIQVSKHIVLDQNNVRHSYKKLILANDALPKKPAIQNLMNSNVLSIGEADDIHHLLDPSLPPQRIAIIGGGLFGIEAARLLKEQNHQLICVEHSSRILFEHLDDHASAYLVDHLEKQGIKTLVQDHIKAIQHYDSSSRIKLASGDTIECDYLLLSTGAKPDTQLAIASGIRVGRGIIINDHLETSQPDIYAIGENAEHRGKINRLLMNGAEQANLLANRFSGVDSSYVGSLSFSRFEIIGYPVMSMGENGDYSSQHQHVTFRDTRRKIYRKIILNKAHITGVIALGDWDHADLARDALRYKMRILPWQIQQFKNHGELSKKPRVTQAQQRLTLNTRLVKYVTKHWGTLALSAGAAFAIFLMLPPIP